MQLWFICYFEFCKKGYTLPRYDITYLSLYPYSVWGKSSSINIGFKKYNIFLVGTLEHF